MDGRSRFAVLAMMAFMGVGFAGCLEAPSFLFASDSEVTAMANRGLADEVAAAWRADAQLVHVFAIESGEDDEVDLPADPAVGNGRAVAWWYAYAVGDETRAWRVTGDGNVTVVNESSEFEVDEDMRVPLSEWRVDSDTAVEKALSNETFSRVALASNATLGEGLTTEENATHWFLVAYSSEGFVFAAVDARTGDLLGVESMELDFDIPAWPGMGGGWGGEPEVVIEDAGRLDGDNVVKEYPFSVSSDGLMAELEILISKELPTDGLRWSVEDASGEAVESGRVGRDGFMEGMAEEAFAIPSAGAYKLVLSYHTEAPLPLGSVDYIFEFTVGGAGWDFEFGWSG